MMTAYNEKKTTQAAGRLLQLWGGQRDYMSLLKILYFVDREALLRWGRPVTFDKYVSMDNGPVLSKTYDLISNGPLPSTDSFWEKHISNPQNYDVKLKEDAGDDELSEAEVSLINEIFQKFGHEGKWELVDISHDFPEWEDPQGSAIPINYRDILKAGNKTDIQIAAIEKELNHRVLADFFFNKK